jgi:hypothetical protein
LLRGHHATPLAAAGTSIGQGWELFRAESGWQLRGAGPVVLVNTEPASPAQVLGGGDRVRVGNDPECLLIEVAP